VKRRSNRATGRVPIEGGENPVDIGLLLSRQSLQSGS